VRPWPASLEAFAASVFVTDDFVNEICAAPRPYLAASIYDRMLAGCSPVLSARQIAQANASTGLNLVVLHFGIRNQDMSDERTQRALQAGSASFFFFHAGYRLNVLLNEVYGRQQADYMAAGGFRLFTSFEGHAGLATVPPDEHPYLFVLRKEWTPLAAVNQISFLFHALLPTVGFTVAEQRVLQHALMNESDVQIADSLCISLDGVKKTWRRIYERTARFAPFLVEGDPPDGDSDHRSREKRRHLLAYLRDHLEELRPFDCTGHNGDADRKAPGTLALRRNDAGC
jgi:DNA-binding CsgD family transcriptional regulator